MPGAWKHPLRPHWLIRLLLHTGEVGGAIALTVLSIYLAVSTERPAWWFWVAVVLGVVAIGSSVLIRFIANWGNREKIYVDCILARLGDEVWSSQVDNLKGPREQHRITLFRAHRVWFPFLRKSTHKLCPCTRHPRSARSPRRRFRVHEHFVQNSEAVAGLVYSAGQKCIVIKDLPDLHTNPSPPPNSYDEYAKKTNDLPKTVRSEKYYSRVIGGMTIYDKNSNRWGVLMFDSRDPNGLDLTELESPEARRLLAILTDIVSGNAL